MTGWRKRQVLEMALKALETAEIDGNCEYGATEIIRKALVQPEQEPVAWVEYETGNNTKRPQNCGTGYCSCIECVMEPAQRTWVGLTDGVMCDIAIEHGLMSIDWIDFARAIEQALKEKNFDRR
jgi:hypothetical protein